MARWLPSALGHGAAAAAALLVLIAVGQPLFTDDAWWHLALGRAFAESGPWLAEDPLLFAAANPPSPSSWLFDLVLHYTRELAGLNGLRALHVAGVASVLGLAWSLLRRASGSALAASAGTVVFIALSTYRLAQLRPDLVTIGFALALYRLLLEPDGPAGRAPSARRIAAAAVLFAVWANAHAAFPVGLLLLGAGAAAVAVSSVMRGAADERPRAIRLSLAWIAGLAATLCNPLGLRAYGAWFAAGESTPSLERVIDEWTPVDLAAWPQPTLPPTPVAWIAVWALLLGAALVALIAVRAAITTARGRAAPRADRPDPAAIGAALISLALMLGAVRFLWLGLFPMLWIARAARPAAAAQAPIAWGLAGAAALCAVAFVRFGDWPLVTRGLPSTLRGYADSYAANKYYADPIWVARAAGLEGRLYCDYFQAGFAGYWLAPRVRTLANGTLNVPAETLRAAAAMGARRGDRPGERFPELLDRFGLDLFLGIRTPETGNPYRPWTSTTAHLENTPGWISVFRSLTSSLYLRDEERNRANLSRVAQYYAAERIPFDPARGFAPLEAISAAPEWAIEHGLAPPDFAALEALAQTGRGEEALEARHRVAAIYVALGLYGEAAALDQATLQIRPQAVRARRRLVWSLLHLRRYAEAAQAADALTRQPAADAVSHAIARASRVLPGLPPDEARARLAALPVFERAEVPWLLLNTARPARRID